MNKYKTTKGEARTTFFLNGILKFLYYFRHFISLENNFQLIYLFIFLTDDPEEKQYIIITVKYASNNYHLDFFYTNHYCQIFPISAFCVIKYWTSHQNCTQYATSGKSDILFIICSNSPGLWFDISKCLAAVVT